MLGNLCSRLSKVQWKKSVSWCIQIQKQSAVFNIQNQNHCKTTNYWLAKDLEMFLKSWLDTLCLVEQFDIHYYNVSKRLLTTKGCFLTANFSLCSTTFYLDVHRVKEHHRHKLERLMKRIKKRTVKYRNKNRKNRNIMVPMFPVSQVKDSTTNKCMPIPRWFSSCHNVGMCCLNSTCDFNHMNFASGEA